MKVLTIKQPWATLIMQGDKRFEFRSWQTKYRGDLLIHAGKGIDKEAMKRLSKATTQEEKSKLDFYLSCGDKSENPVINDRNSKVLKLLFEDSEFIPQSYTFQLKTPLKNAKLSAKFCCAWSLV